MDNFRKFRAPERRNSSAVDGFVSGRANRNPHLGRNPSRPQHTRHQADEKSNRPQRSIGGFSGTEGFHPNTRPELEASAQNRSAQHAAPGLNGQGPSLPSAPVSGSGKRGLFSFGRKKKPTGRGSDKNTGKRNWRKIALRGGIGVLVLTLLISGFLIGKGYLKVRGIFKGGGNAPALAENVDPTKLNGEGDGRVNIMLLGRGGGNHAGADLTDTILVASIDPVNKNASILSIPRDLWVKNPGGGQSKINAVFANARNNALTGRKTADSDKQATQAGINALESVVESTMGIPVHYYAMIDFQGFVQAIDTVGGVDLYIAPTDTSLIVKETLWNDVSGGKYNLNVGAGNNHFDGQRALMYSRSRYTSVRGDFDRSERQRKVIVALKEKVLTLGTFGNPVKLNQLISDFGDHAQANMSTAELMRVYEIIKTIESSKITSVGLADPPNNFVQTDNVEGQSIVRPRAGLFDYSQIQNYVRNTLKDGFIQNENASIAVYNGSGINGLAASKSTDLKSYGYNITTTANAPSEQVQTMLVDLTNGSKKYTKHYLEKRLNVTAVTSVPAGITAPTGTDFVIILGKNESTSP